MTADAKEISWWKLVPHSTKPNIPGEISDRAGTPLEIRGAGHFTMGWGRRKFSAYTDEVRGRFMQEPRQNPTTKEA